MRKDHRIKQILDQIVRFSNGNFNGHIAISERLDEIDAISAGLNNLADLIKSRPDASGSSSKEVTSRSQLHLTDNKLDIKGGKKDFAGLGRNREAFADCVFQHAPDSIIIIGEKGHIVDWNPAADLFFGWTRSNITNKLVHEIFSPIKSQSEQIHAFTRILDADLKNNVNKILHLSTIGHKGTEIEIEMTVSAVHKNERKFFIAFVRDCSERVLASKEVASVNANLEQRIRERSDALYESERKYKTLFENNPMPMWVLDATSLRFLDVNESAVQQYQYSRDEFLKMTSLDIRPADEKALYQQLDRKTTGTKNRGVWKHFRKDGSLLYASILVHEFAFEGKPARLVLCQDVTEQKRAEDLLKLSEKRFKGIFESDLIGFVLWDTQTGILEANDIFVSMLGFTREDLKLGLIDWGQLTPGEFSMLDHEALKQVHSNGACKPFEKEYVKKDRSRLPVSVGVARIEDDLYVSYILDISQQEQLKNQVLELNRSLEEKVNERTAELLAANNELESFSYSVSHDLRSPLRAIHGYAQMLVEDYQQHIDNNGLRLLSNIQAQARQMGQLIDDLLTFSRMGKRQLNRSEINMNALVETVLNGMRGVELGNVNIIVQPLGNEHADPSLTRIVLENLIGNAIKYSSKKANPDIEVGTLTVDGIKTYFVKDNGAGFDMKYYDKLFGVFHRLHGDYEFEGTGVGLAIVHRVVTKHGGRVWAHAAVGQGAIFYFTLN